MVRRYLVIKERQSFDLENEEIIGVFRVAGGVLFVRPDSCGEDGPLKLQHAISHVHLAHVPEVVCPHIPAKMEAVQNAGRVEGHNITLGNLL